MGKLEKSFKETLSKAHEEIKVHQDIAFAELDKAVEVCEKYGIPFRFDISCLSNRYVPESFREKWNKLDAEILEEYNIYVDEYDDGGWQHSAVY